MSKYSLPYLIASEVNFTIYQLGAGNNAAERVSTLYINTSPETLKLAARIARDTRKLQNLLRQDFKTWKKEKG